MTTDRPILLFDGVCNLCGSAVSFIKRHDTSKIIMFSPLQSDKARLLLVRYGLPMDYTKSMDYIKENKYYINSSAVLNILRDLGGGWSLFYGFVIIPEFIRDFMYNILARIRYRVFGKTFVCLNPDS
jgi:predicted DCC family thiol-disulfide oxidoreductase YuxK